MIKPALGKPEYEGERRGKISLPEIYMSVDFGNIQLAHVQKSKQIKLKLSLNTKKKKKIAN